MNFAAAVFHRTLRLAFFCLHHNYYTVYSALIGKLGDNHTLGYDFYMLMMLNQTFGLKSLK